MIRNCQYVVVAVGVPAVSVAVIIGNAAAGATASDASDSTPSPVAVLRPHLELVVRAVGQAGHRVAQRGRGGRDFGPVGVEVAGALFLVLPPGQGAAAAHRRRHRQLAAARTVAAVGLPGLPGLVRYDDVASSFAAVQLLSLYAL